MSWDTFLKEVADIHGLFDEDNRQVFLCRFAEQNLQHLDAQVAHQLMISEVTLQRRLEIVYAVFAPSCPTINSAKKGKFKILRNWLKTEYIQYISLVKLPGEPTTSKLEIGNRLSQVLHLSDLHFGTTDNARIWYAQLAEDLRYELNCSRLDALILSGDIASKSTPDEYAAAQLFISRLCQEFQLDPQQIAIVPGNHDLNWELAESAYIGTNREDYQGELKEGCYLEESGSVIKVRDEAIYKQRFAHFSRFYQEITGNNYPLEYDQQYSLQHLPEQLVERIGSRLSETLWNQPTLTLGEVFVTDADSLPASYLIHTPTEEKPERHTIASVVRGVTAALSKADSMGDVRTIAFPSVGSGAAQLNPLDLARQVLTAIINHLKQGSCLEKVIFAFLDEPAYQAYVSAYQTLVQESNLVYCISLTRSPEVTSVDGVIEVSISLKSVGKVDEKDYMFELPKSEAIGSELNILLNAPGFQFNGDNTASLPLDPDANGETLTRQLTQTATFCLTALRSGTATINVELYRGDTFETTRETQVQVAEFDTTSFTPKRITTQPRPVPQPDFILRIQTAGNDTNSACQFQYQLRSFRIPSLFPGEINYHSEFLSSRWLEQMRGLLGTTLETISDALPEDGRSRLNSLGQYLFSHLLPRELQNDLHTVTRLNRTFTLLILADQDSALP